MNSDLQKLIFKSPGYCKKFQLNDSELDFIKSAISKQWYENIKKESESLGNFIKTENIQIHNYHLISDKIDHSKIWSKRARILSLDFLLRFKETKFFKLLINKFDYIDISDEENLGYGNIYWRIVRPNMNNDIGPIHRDSWFWALNEDFPKPDFDFTRIKVWIAIETEPNKSGLMIEKDSHLRKDIIWGGELRDGINKPVISSDNKEFNMKIIATKPGDTLIFNDDLIHGGALNTSNKTRVSIEFTLICKKVD